MRMRALPSALLALVLVAAGAGCSNAAAERANSGQPTPTVEVTPSSTPTPYDPVFPAGTTVAFFGDSQATIMLRQDRRPPWLADYLNVVDRSIEGCGILLGRIRSRSGEGRNLATDYRCSDWASVWRSRIREGAPPDVSVIMIGAWEVVDLTLPSGEEVGFGTARWDEYFNLSLTRAITVLRSVDRPVALALLPCYRPVTSSRNTGSGYWPERGDDGRTRHINDLLVAAAARYPSGVFTLEPPEQFCNDPVLANASRYRGDGLHTTPCGANLYFKAYVRQLIGVEPGPPTPAGSGWECEV